MAPIRKMLGQARSDLQRGLLTAQAKIAGDRPNSKFLWFGIRLKRVRKSTEDADV